METPLHGYPGTKIPPAKSVRKQNQRLYIYFQIIQDNLNNTIKTFKKTVIISTLMADPLQELKTISLSRPP